MIDFFSDYQVIISFSVNLILAFITFISAFIAFKSYQETKKMRELQSDPEVVIYFEIYQLNTIYLVIENIGSGSAYNISFQVSSNLENIFGSHIKDLRMLYRGIKYLGPGMKRKSFIGMSFGKVEDFLENSFEISTSYYNKLKNETGKKLGGNFMLDFSEFLGVHSLSGQEPVDKFANLVKKTNDILTQIKTEISKNNKSNK